MKKAFKAFVVILCLSMLASLLACTKENKNENESLQTSDTTVASELKTDDPPAKPAFEKMEYFKNYVSNTLAGTSNQLYFDNTAANGAVSEGMIFYKATVGGEFEYSLLFSDTIDSTYARGEQGVPNMKLEDFEVTGVKLGVMPGNVSATPYNAENKVTFVSTTISKYEHTNNVTYFETSPVKLNAAANDYIVVIVEFKGTRVPCHVESLVPTFKKENGSWSSNKNVPTANMVGIKREVKATIAYLGDSITQGIGVGENQYTFWNAVTSKKLGNDYSYWNLGIGYARCKDVATDGAWMFKAKQADYVVVCLGTNDIGTENADGPTLCANLEKVIDQLNEAGCKVILQTVPPYTHADSKLDAWYYVNDYIKNTLSQKVVAVFDQTELLMTEEKIPNQPRYGGHPNHLGCEVWGKALYEFLISNVEDFKLH